MVQSGFRFERILWTFPHMLSKGQRVRVRGLPPCVRLPPVPYSVLGSVHVCLCSLTSSFKASEVDAMMVGC